MIKIISIYFFPFILILICCCFSLIESVLVYLPNSQYQALHSLYNSTRGNQWKWLTPYSTYGYPWEFSSDAYNNPCNSTFPWQGVKCSTLCNSNGCNVTSIILNSRNLQGSIPSDIGNLSSLTYFELYSNKLNGTIPSGIRHMKKLTFLNLYSNKLTGSIPPEICSINSLLYLYLYQNSLTGTIPNEIGNLTNLQQLKLFQNFLTGTVPSHIGNLTKLQYLEIDQNYLTGSIPKEIGNLKYVTYCYLYSNYLTGSIPPEIGKMTRLTSLFLYSNQLSGSIPTQIGQLSQLSIFIAYDNKFSGSLPSQIGQLTFLSLIDLNSNLLTGSIPSSIGQMSQLSSISFYGNALTGSLPTSIGLLTRLQTLNVHTNKMTGSIPTEIKNTTSMVYLYLFSNQFTGTIPPEIGQLTKLSYLYLQNNIFSGSIPFSVGLLTSIINLYLYQNRFSGPFPESIGSLTNLINFNAYSNYFSGLLPSSVGNLTKLYSFELYSNQFSKTIPQTISSAVELQYVYMNDNYFTGMVPESISQLSSLESLDLSNNFISECLVIPKNLNFLALRMNLLSSSIPSTLFYHKNLYYVDLSYNQFSSSLPFNSSSYHNIVFLDVSSNQLSGSLPPNLLNKANSMVYLSLANNKFIGHLPNSTTSKGLSVLYLQNNSFSGTIPSQLIGVGSLKIFVASMNCFSGTIPDSFCANTDLIQLILDGLHSSDSCIQHIIPWLGTSSYTIYNGVSGTIPTCLFNLKNLLSLHLSGNNIHGQLPSTINNSDHSNLTTLILANNRISGSIPKYLLSNEKLTNLDLSFNLFSAFGEDSSQIKSFSPKNVSEIISALHINFTTNSTLTPSLRLQVNHLSGKVPKAWKQSENIDILEGNIFQCDLDRSDLPMHDSHQNSYSCGSDQTNNSFYITLGICSVMFVYLIYFFGWDFIKQYLVDFESLGSNKLRLSIHAWQTMNQEKENHYKMSENIDVMSLEYERLGKLFKIFIIWIVILISSMYIGLTFSYGTYRHQYIWILSSSYLSGISPAMIMLVMYLAIIIWYINCFITENKIDTTVPHATTFQNIKEYFLFHNNYNHLVQLDWFRFVKKILFVLFDIIVVLSVNIAYVTAINHGYNYSILSLISFSLSIFKLFWNNILLLGYGRKWLEKHLLIVFDGKLILLLTIFNNVIVPYLAEGFISPNCFLYAINDPPIIDTKYYNIHCSPVQSCYQIESTSICEVTLDCSSDSFTKSMVQDSFVDSSYLPPFHYNFTCSSSLLSAFAYVFVYRYIITLFIEPMVWLLVKNFQKTYSLSFAKNYIYGLFCSTIKSNQDWLIILSKILPLLWKVEIFYSDNIIIEGKTTIKMKHKEFDDHPIEAKEVSEINSSNVLANYDASIITLDATLFGFERSINIGEKSAISLILDLTMFLSFGVLFPPLGILVFFSLMKDIMIQQYQLNQILKHILQTHDIQESDNISHKPSVIKSKLIDIWKEINNQYKSWFSLYGNGLWWSILVAGWFWAFCLYDTLGPSQGSIPSLWILLVMGFSPYIIMACKYIIYKLCLISQDIKHNNRKSQFEIENDSNSFEINPIRESNISSVSTSV